MIERGYKRGLNHTNPTQNPLQICSKRDYPDQDSEPNCLGKKVLKVSFNYLDQDSETILIWIVSEKKSLNFYCFSDLDSCFLVSESFVLG